MRDGIVRNEKKTERRYCSHSGAVLLCVMMCDIGVFLVSVHRECHKKENIRIWSTAAACAVRTR